MLHFIPSWYLNNNEWKESEQIWYIRRMHSETDDTVKQIQLFHRNHICDYQILLLSHAPNFRHFLHRQGVFRAPYWSAFDAMQEVRRRKPAVLSFHNLNWPREIEFIYSFFAVIAFLHGEKYAQVEFGEYGNPIQVDLYGGGQLKRRNIYDDRGFVSCTVIYENGRMAYEQYLTEKGVWKLCRFADGHVAVNPKSAYFLIQSSEGEREIPYRQKTYSSMEEVLGEVLSAYLETLPAEDIFCAALHGQHARLLDQCLEGRKRVYCVFGERLSPRGNREILQTISHINCIVADSEDDLALLMEEPLLRNREMRLLPPYDTRIETGISQQLSVQKILLPVDHLSEGELEEAVWRLAEYLPRNKDARVHLFTRNAVYNREDILLEQVRRILEKHDFPAAWARKEKDNKFEFLLEEEERLPILFRVEQCLNDLAVNKCVREQRILLELAKAPDLFLQISCVSMGVPQLLRAGNRYMVPGRNGSAVPDLSKLGEELDYYLGNLTNWNRAMIQSYEIGKKYTVEALIQQWKEVIDYVEYNTGFTAGRS